MMLVAVTGGIGSGKSAVTELFKARGANVLSADEINAELLSRPDYVTVLAQNFPSAVKNGTVDRKKLGEIVFHDETERKKLNALAHPIILTEIERRAKALKGLAVVEIPLLNEAGDKTRFDRIIAVIAPRALRLKRVAERDGVSEDYARAVVSSQASDEAYQNIATDVVYNNGSVSELAERVDEMLHTWAVQK